MSIAYQYNASGYFVGEIEDYGLLPSNATYTRPKLIEEYVPCWNGKAWEQVEDHKGKQGFVNGQPHTIKEYGPLPEGWSDAPPPPPAPTLADQITEVQAPFISEQAAIKADFVTARMEQDAEWEADLQADYQDSLENMAAATAKLLGA